MDGKRPFAARSGVDWIAAEAAGQDDPIRSWVRQFSLSLFFVLDLDWRAAASYRKRGMICSVNTFM
jgi:hypothetical protein